MKLYDFPFSPNCRKVRAVAYELGVALEFVRVELLSSRESHTPAFLAINPNGRVPVLDDDGFLLWESTAIQRYLAAGTALLPTARRAAADVDRWLAWQLAHLGPAMSKVGYERIVKQARRLGPPCWIVRLPTASTSPARCPSPTSRSRRTTRWPRRAASSSPRPQSNRGSRGCSRAIA